MSIKSLENRVYNDLMLILLNPFRVSLSNSGLNRSFQIVSADINNYNFVTASTDTLFSNSIAISALNGFADSSVEVLAANISLDSAYFRRNVINYVDE